MKKTISLVLFILMVASIVTACAAAPSTSPSPAASAAPSVAASASQASSAPASTAAKDAYNIAIITKNSQTAFWQYCYIGANNAAVDNPKIKVVTNGPPSSKDIDKQVQILEDTINNKPDGIVLAPLNGDSLKPGVEKAMDMGIKVVLIDSAVNSDKFVTLLGTDNIAAAGKGAETFVEKLKAKNIPLKGKVAMISPYGGVQYLLDRENGFAQKLKELAPDIEVIGPKYYENDPIKGVGIVEDLLTANSDMIGFYATNNMGGVAISRVVTERNLASKLVSVSFDSDPEEVSGINSGSLDALIVQDPYTLGYNGVTSCVDAIDGKTLEKRIVTDVALVTKENVNEQNMKELLDPTLKKKY
jgi:ribose transport system substrate-binding protein